MPVAKAKKTLVRDVVERAWRWQLFWKRCPKEAGFQEEQRKVGICLGREGLYFIFYFFATGDRNLTVPREGVVCKYLLTG